MNYNRGVSDDLLSAGDYCGTQGAGWVNGTNPTGLGETVDAEVCFDLTGGPCLSKQNIKIKNCATYYVYYLPDVPFCKQRYCSIFDATQSPLPPFAFRDTVLSIR